MQTEDWLARFQRIASFHAGAFVQQTFDDYDRFKASKPDWLALQMFVRGYAFEHSGRVPVFPLIAEDVCKDLSQLWSLSMPETAREVWNEFVKRAHALSYKKLNEPNNPLTPSGTKFKRNEKLRTTNGISAIEFASEPDRGNIIEWTIRMLNGDSGNSAKTAHVDLTRINGVGDKIASLWLRDVAYRYDITISDEDLRKFLFPVDIWVRRTAETLSGRKFQNDALCAKWCIEKCGNNFSPEKINMGFWYFGAQIVLNEELMRRVLNDNDTNRFDELVLLHYRRLRGAVDQYDTDNKASAT